jgi:hypothetical protein
MAIFRIAPVVHRVFLISAVASLLDAAYFVAIFTTVHLPVVKVNAPTTDYASVSRASALTE